MLTPVLHKRSDPFTSFAGLQSKLKMRKRCCCVPSWPCLFHLAYQFEEEALGLHFSSTGWTAGSSLLAEAVASHSFHFISLRNINQQWMNLKVVPTIPSYIWRVSFTCTYNHGLVTIALATLVFQFNLRVKPTKSWSILLYISPPMLQGRLGPGMFTIFFKVSFYPSLIGSDWLVGSHNRILAHINVRWA